MACDRAACRQRPPQPRHCRATRHHSTDGRDLAQTARRFRLDGLLDEPRPGAPRKIGDEKIAEVVTTTLKKMPAVARHWSRRANGQGPSGLSGSTVHRIWRPFSLQPHRCETFKLSTDPLFVEKVRDIIGLYLDPPDRALVLCVDENRHQALDRTQPLLPRRPGQAERRTRDYKHHGTTSLFAALDVKSGTIISRLHAASSCGRVPPLSRHRRESNVPNDLDIHVVMNNASSDKTKLIRNWFAKRANWPPHFTPTSSSWINQVERFFALLTEQQIRRGAHRSPRNSKRPSRPMSRLATRNRSPSDGPRRPMTSWRQSSGSAGARSTSRPNVGRNFGIRTLGPTNHEHEPGSSRPGSFLAARQPSNFGSRRRQAIALDRGPERD